MGFCLVIALTLRAMTRPGAVVVDVLAFLGWALLLTPSVIALLRLLVRLPPPDPDEAARRIQAYRGGLDSARRALEAGDHAAALESLAEAEDALPGRLEVLFATAEVWRGRGDLAKAVATLDDAAPVHAGVPAFHLALARLACLAGDLDRAREELEVAAAVEPSVWRHAAGMPDLAPLAGWVASRAG
jgi:uncharacterized protein HemY